MTNLRRLGAAFLMVALFGALLAPAALADSHAADSSSSDTNVTVTAGTLNMDAISVGDFAGVTIDGRNQTTNATLADFNVRDFRGTGAGWNVTVQASQFTEVDGTETLAAGSLTLVAPRATAVGDTTSSVPTVTSGPYTIDAGGAMPVASAAVDQGMGEYTFAFGADSLALAIPSDVVAATYRSTVTVDLVSGP